MHLIVLQVAYAVATLNIKSFIYIIYIYIALESSDMPILQKRDLDFGAYDWHVLTYANLI